MPQSCIRSLSVPYSINDLSLLRELVRVNVLTDDIFSIVEFSSHSVDIIPVGIIIPAAETLIEVEAEFFMYSFVCEKQGRLSTSLNMNIIGTDHDGFISGKFFPDLFIPTWSPEEDVVSEVSRIGCEAFI
jgi:hypothetical protein